MLEAKTFLLCLLWPCLSLSFTVQWSLVRGNETANQPEIITGYVAPFRTGYPGARYKAAFTQQGNTTYLYAGRNTFDRTGGVTTYAFSDPWQSEPTFNPYEFRYAEDGTHNYANSGRDCGLSSDAQPGNLLGACTWPGEALGLNGYIIFGGFYWANFFGSQHVADMWHYDPDAMEWNYLSGYSCSVDPPTLPSPRQGSACWSEEGLLYVFGGSGADGAYSDLWTFNGTVWTLLDAGEINGNGSSTYPGARAYANYWKTENGRVYIQGGRNAFGQDYSDHWVLKNSEWKLLHDDGLNAEPSYPAVGEAGQPGARSGSATWTQGDDLFLFGGSVGTNAARSDLWIWKKGNRHSWYYLGGPTSTNDTGSYHSPPYWPAARAWPAHWNDPLSTDKLLFGGARPGTNSGSTTFNAGGVGALNDYWALNVTYHAGCSP